MNNRAFTTSGKGAGPSREVSSGKVHGREIPSREILSREEASAMLTRHLQCWDAFVPDHHAWMCTLCEVLPLQQEAVRMFGKTHLTPRLVSLHGDPGLRYRYAGQRFDASPWVPALQTLRAKLLATLGTDFNAVLVNFYRDGDDAMGFHADDEPEIGPSPEDRRIASISLGDSRNFVIRGRGSHQDLRLVMPLNGGSLLVMDGPLQRHFVHGIPRTRRPVGPRLNLTFRCMHTAPR